ncbi:putative membrane protein [Aequitasia blattaphilus]|uniref:ECF transporter S component n=1 Tax=Aequitasia blattaphilus TaxID=2949332 RepID=A0ABT1EAH3_9FIRM|nr:ECF transporter S component [Aequitasia blattaphilus]MCP1102825.1 ECF transporter S component [Aequitasia blattaphilus]MCR8615465.1 ECF transporter S component [Aequitasia blattaphilus]
MNNTNSKTKSMVQLAVLVAILIVLTVTNLGFITTGVVSITLLHIPVIVGSLTMGPFYGGILGFAFGCISMLNATFRGVTPVDMMFTPAGGHGMPIQAIIMCIVPRVLLGILPFLIYKVFSKMIKKDFVSMAISAGIGTILHTIMVLGCLYFFFFTDMDFSAVVKNVFLTVVGINGILETVAAILICGGVCAPLKKLINRN